LRCPRDRGDLPPRFLEGNEWKILLKSIDCLVSTDKNGPE
jgi:hypothetical protein